MNTPIIFFIVYSVVILILSFEVLFLVRRIRFLKMNANTKEKNFPPKNIKNPLGTLFSSNTKSFSISIKKDGKITAINNNLSGLLGYTQKQLLGKNIYGTLIHPLSQKEPLEMNLITRIFQNPKLYTECEMELLTKEKNKIWISWTNRIIEDKKGNPIELHSVGFDITERKKLEEELQFMASKDPQTGVLNRLALLENGTRELKRSIRYKHDFSVLAFRMLSLNEKLSSLEVEKLLKQVVAVCRKTIRDTDYIGRIGEAEFILLLPETEKENVPFLQKRLEENISEHNRKNPQMPISVSFGVSSYNSKTRSIDELISKAIANIKKRKLK